jgi:hypothetical protein
MSQPYFEGVWGWDSSSQNGDLGVHRDSRNFRVQWQGSKHLTLRRFYIIGKLSKCRCRKWACMSHLDICSTSYGKKKGRESNWQFNSRPLKVVNRPDRSACRWSATHCLKALNESYKLASNLAQSEVWANSCSPAKLRESKPGQFWGSSLGVPGQKAIRM